jgi:hypothetical protein
MCLSIIKDVAPTLFSPYVQVTRYVKITMWTTDQCRNSKGDKGNTIWPWRVPREPGVAATGAEPHGAGGPHSVGMARYGNKRRAKYYSLTANGRRTPSAETERWANQTAAIARILEAKAGA